MPTPIWKFFERCFRERPFPEKSFSCSEVIVSRFIQPLPVAAWAYVSELWRSLVRNSKKKKGILSSADISVMQSGDVWWPEGGSAVWMCKSRRGHFLTTWRWRPVTDEVPASSLSRSNRAAAAVTDETNLHEQLYTQQERSHWHLHT